MVFLAERWCLLIDSSSAQFKGHQFMKVCLGLLTGVVGKETVPGLAGTQGVWRLAWSHLSASSEERFSAGILASAGVA